MKNKIKQKKQKPKSGVFNYLHSTVYRFWPKWMWERPMITKTNRNHEHTSHIGSAQLANNYETMFNIISH